MSDTLLRIANIVIVGGPEAMLKGMGKIYREVLQGAIRHWHAKFLPLHFRPGAEGRYGYKPRLSKSRRRRPHLVRTGRTRDMATRGIYTRGSARRATGKFFVPGYITTRYRSRPMPDMVREIKATTEQEKAEIRVIVRREALTRLRALRTRKAVRI